MTELDYAKGLEGVIAAESEICQIDGANGKLYYRGYSIEDLAQHSSFEETTYLLLYEKLPSEQELADFSSRMRRCRDLSPVVQNMIADGVAAIDHLLSEQLGRASDQAFRDMQLSSNAAPGCSDDDSHRHLPAL